VDDNFILTIDFGLVILLTKIYIFVQVAQQRIRSPVKRTQRWLVDGHTVDVALGYTINHSVKIGTLSLLDFTHSNNFNKFDSIKNIYI